MNKKNISSISRFMTEELAKMWEIEASELHKESNIEESLENNVDFITTTDEISQEIIGILEYKITWPWDQKVCLLKWTIVHERYRGLGLAKKLKNELEWILVSLDVAKIITKVKDSNIISKEMNLSMWYTVVENDDYLKSNWEEKWYEKIIKKHKNNIWKTTKQ